MTEKPSYIGLLNAISNAEGEAEGYLDAWAAVTPRADVRAVISTIALREGEHAKAFAKRMCELGYDVRPKGDGKESERMAIAASTELSDKEKFEKLGLGRSEDGPDIFARMFDDTTIDIQTGGLLGRYIAEERDSGRMFRDCYGALCADTAPSDGHAGNGQTGGAEDRLARIEELLGKLVDRLA